MAWCRGEDPILLFGRVLVLKLGLVICYHTEIFCGLPQVTSIEILKHGTTNSIQIPPNSSAIISLGAAEPQLPSAS
jgi:hypothetical protein